VSEQDCRICGDSEPFHVHNGDIRIEDFSTVGRGMTDLEAANIWKRRALMTERELGKVRAELPEIRASLDTIAAHMMWLIRAEQRFRIGRRVEFSRRARDRGFPKRKQSAKGVIKGFDGFSVDVLLDGYKHRHTYHHAFFNPVSGPKLF
jgi:hypothetical protein